MRYCHIYEQHKEHILKLVDFLWNEVASAGGDGDGLWYSRFYDIVEIFPLVENYNKERKINWELKLENDTIHWYDGQESLIITNDEGMYVSAPDWQQILIKY